MWKPKAPEWPGIATAAVIIFILAAIIVVTDDQVHLKDWQTLISSMIALCAAGIAYLAAMVKVREDREAERRKDRRSLRGVCLRLHYASLAIKVEAKAYRDQLNSASTAGDQVDVVKRLYFKEVEQISEAWNSLEVLPTEVAKIIYALKVCLHNIADTIEHFEGKQAIRPNAISTAEKVVSTNRALHLLIENVEKLSPALRKTVSGLPIEY